MRIFTILLFFCFTSSLTAENLKVFVLDRKYQPSAYSKVTAVTYSSSAAIPYEEERYTDHQGVLTVDVSEDDKEVEFSFEHGKTSRIPLDYLLNGSSIINTSGEFLYTDSPTSSESSEAGSEPSETGPITTVTRTDNSSCAITVSYSGSYCYWCEVLKQSIRQIKQDPKYSCLQVRHASYGAPYPKWSVGGVMHTGGAYAHQLREVLGGLCDCSGKPQPPKEPEQKFCYYIVNDYKPVGGDIVRLRNVLCDTKSNVDWYKRNPRNERRPTHKYVNIEILDTPASGVAECDTVEDCFEPHVLGCEDTITVCGEEEEKGLFPDIISKDALLDEQVSEE
ncbi:MAG: hypothetical protein KDD62_12330, partial [Bdellovibrionales bacterium]|nr:hypothetical protein [Bdellovibrionales bacterium]